MLRGSSPHTDAQQTGQTLGNWPPTPRLRGKREGLLEKRGLSWAPEYLKVEEQKGFLSRRKEQRKEEEKGQCLAKQDFIEGRARGRVKCWVCNTHWEQPVSILYDGNQGRFGSRKLTWLESGSKRSRLQPPSALQ